MKTLAIVASLFAAHAAIADEPFWRELREPELREYDDLIERGEDIVRAAENPDLELLVRERIDVRDALVHFDRAITLRPNDPRAHVARADALQSDKVGRLRDAIEALRRARTLDVDGALEQRISFDLGISLTKAGDFEAATVEYDRALKHAVTPHSRSTTLANWAEILMGMGRLREAIERYEAAIAEMRPDSPTYLASRALGQYGLAVALDRDDQRSRALEVMRDAWAADPKRGDEYPNGLLTRPNQWGIFFVPENEIHYYTALQLEARAERESDRARRVALIDGAANAWQEYLASGGASGRWARQALEHAEATDRRPRRAPRGRAGEPRPGLDPPLRAP